MALKFRSTDRFIKPDPVYNSKLVSKFIGCLMRAGKRSVAEQVFYQAMDILRERVEDKQPLEVFEQAVDNVKPVIEVRSRRIGGMTYQVPTEVNSRRQTSLAMRWILEAAREKKGRPMYLRLADELLDAYRKQGAAYTRRENTHKMAEANRDFAHFAQR
jgi:small subunit ribosomal protein S7